MKSLALLVHMFVINASVSAFSIGPTTQLQLVPKVDSSGPPFSRKSSLNMLDIPFHIITDAYSDSLLEHPFVTKGTTGFILCGLGDIIAQVRGFNAANQEELVKASQQINYQRLARFAAKGFFGTSIWAAWYDYSDHLLNSENVMAALLAVGITHANDTTLNVVRTLMLISIEQFVTCPIVFGCWEIPVSTILNGAPLSKIPREIKDKSGDLLIANAKVWTFANVLIYNVPVQYRTALSSMCDLVWQSIVSEFAARCGSDDEQLEAVMCDDMPLISKNPVVGSPLFATVGDNKMTVTMERVCS